MAPPAALVVLVGTGYDLYIGLDTATRAYDQALLSTAVALEPHLLQLDGEPVFRLPPAAEAVLRADRHDQVFFAVRTPDGRHVAGDADLPALPLPAGQQRRYADATMRGVPVRVVVARLPTDAGEMQFLVAETVAKRERTMWELGINVALVNLLLLALVAAAVRYGVDRGLRPLAQLRRQLQARSHRDLRSLDAGGAPDELRPVIDEINSLFVRLEAAAATQNRFVANAAHQLRTPLAGLQTQLELARAQALPAQAAETVARSHDATVRLARMASQLLALARVEPEANEPHHDRVDLAALVGSGVNEWVHAALAADVDLGFELDAAWVWGDATLLRELAANLIDNAIRYAGAGARITVRTAARDGDGLLQVEDDGPGIAPAERERVQERFYRVAGSPGPGSGLGLAIVAEIAAMHGARLVLDAGEGGRGLCATVRFSACGAQRPGQREQPFE